MHILLIAGLVLVAWVIIGAVYNRCFNRDESDQRYEECPYDQG